MPMFWSSEHDGLSVAIFKEKLGIGFDDVYAPVASEAATKMILLIIAILNLECEKFDIISAYLNTALKKHKVFMHQVTGFGSAAYEIDVFAADTFTDEPSTSHLHREVTLTVDSTSTERTLPNGVHVYASNQEHANALETLVAQFPVWGESEVSLTYPKRSGWTFP